MDLIYGNNTTLLQKKPNGLYIAKNGEGGNFIQHVSVQGKHIIVCNVVSLLGNVFIAYYDESGKKWVKQQLKNGPNNLSFNTSVTKVGIVLDGTGINSNVTIEYIRLYEGNIEYKGQKEDYATALMRCLPYCEYGEFAVQYNNTTYFISGFTYKFPKKDTPNIIFIKTVVDENGNVIGTFEAVSQNACSCPFIRYNEKSAVGLGNKTLNVRVLITCEKL